MNFSTTLLPLPTRAALARARVQAYRGRPASKASREEEGKPHTPCRLFTPQGGREKV
jgi:hypothetical protein